MKVLSFNIHKGMDINNKFSLKDIISFLISSNADIICLQEVLSPQFKKIKSDLDMYGVFACNTKSAGIPYGICTLSRKKIESSNHTFLTSIKEQRGILSIEFEGDRNNINIINVHLGLDRKERAKQIDEIINYGDRLIGDTIICGDFNEKNVSINKFIDMAVALEDYKSPTFIPSKSRIDYIFISKNLEPRYYSVEGFEGSDHYPIEGGFN